MALTGNQFGELLNALADAFPAEAKLARMVRVRLGKNLARIAMGSDLDEIIHGLLQSSEAENWTSDLVVAARQSNPGNPKLFAIAQKLDLAPVTPAALERIIARSGFADVERFRSKLGEMQARVCQIEIPLGTAKCSGTGFLVGPSLVLTNHHVIEPIIADKQLVQGVILRFDYAALPDGKAVSSGTEFRLHKFDWLVDRSPGSPVDSITEPKPTLPQADQLDYALLRVEGEPGKQPIGENAEPGAPNRGWIPVPSYGTNLQKDDQLLILQHPNCAPLKLAVDRVLSLNANATRITYTTDTLPGSSGSPCFNINFDLVALHQGGDPDFSPTHNPVYNQGIPIPAILQLLDQHGLRDILG